MMDLERMPVDGVTVGPRHRPLDEWKIQALVESMKAIGLQQPISVWMESDSAVHLVAGLHRLEAARRLGWEDIPAIFVKMDGIARELWEIDENLMRAELSDNEKREHLRRRKELWEAQETGGKSFPTSLKDGRKAGPQHQKSFAAETAAATGLSKRRVNQLLADPNPKAPPAPPSEFPKTDYERSAAWRRRFEAVWNSAPAMTDYEWARDWIDKPTK